MLPATIPSRVSATSASETVFSGRAPIEEHIRAELGRWGNMLGLATLERMVDACDVTDELKLTHSASYRRAQQELQRLYGIALIEATALILRSGVPLRAGTALERQQEHQ